MDFSLSLVYYNMLGDVHPYIPALDWFHRKRWWPKSPCCHKHWIGLSDHLQESPFFTLTKNHLRFFFRKNHMVSGVSMFPIKTIGWQPHHTKTPGPVWIWNGFLFISCGYIQPKPQPNDDNLRWSWVMTGCTLWLCQIAIENGHL